MGTGVRPRADTSELARQDRADSTCRRAVSMANSPRRGRPPLFLPNLPARPRLATSSPRICYSRAADRVHLTSRTWRASADADAPSPREPPQVKAAVIEPIVAGALVKPARRGQIFP